MHFSVRVIVSLFFGIFHLLLDRKVEHDRR